MDFQKFFCRGAKHLNRSSEVLFMLVRGYKGKWMYGEVFNGVNAEWYSYTNSRLHQKQLEPQKHNTNKPQEEYDELQVSGEEVVPLLPAFVCPRMPCTPGIKSCEVLPGLLCDGTMNRKGSCNFRSHEDFERHLIIPTPAVTINERQHYSDEDFSFNLALEHVRKNIECPIHKLWGMFGVLLQFGELIKPCDTWFADFTRVLRICQGVYNEVIDWRIKIERPVLGYCASRPVQARETDTGTMQRLDQYDRDKAQTAKTHIMKCSLKVASRAQPMHTRSAIELEELNALAEQGDRAAKQMVNDLRRGSVIP